MNGTEFYRAVEKLCKKQGLSITSLGAKAGFAGSTASGWLTGSKPHHSTVLKIAEYFNVPVESLSGENVSQSRVQTNNGAIGNFNAPVTISNGSERTLSTNEIEMLRMFTKLEAIDQAKVLVFTNELLEKNKK